MADRPQYIHQPEVFWKYHIDGWLSTTLTQSEYCRIHNLSKSSFSRWKSKLKDMNRRNERLNVRKLEDTPQYRFRCSCCGKRADQTIRLFPGVTTSICSDCMETAARMYYKWRIVVGGHQQCIFCKRNEKMVKHLVGDGLNNICDECVDQCRALLQGNLAD